MQDSRQYGAYDDVLWLEWLVVEDEQGRDDDHELLLAMYWSPRQEQE